MLKLIAGFVCFLGYVTLGFCLSLDGSDPVLNKCLYSCLDVWGDCPSSYGDPCIAGRDCLRYCKLKQQREDEAVEEKITTIIGPLSDRFLYGRIDHYNICSNTIPYSRLWNPCHFYEENKSSTQKGRLISRMSKLIATFVCILGCVTFGFCLSLDTNDPVLSSCMMLCYDKWGDCPRKNGTPCVSGMDCLYYCKLKKLRKDVNRRWRELRKNMKNWRKRSHPDWTELFVSLRLKGAN
ncbi:hypothetical protein CSKR_202640 [Clonorchis sinensis]|uniref:Uncharacterized protein n=1 Tax=Clonorchis sinensis TaxID=79923 RepID=A0A8T1M1Q9_CLOSI|nr:hypothetical protein CSKR_202640 [Clonorchis sinensis]